MVQSGRAYVSLACASVLIGVLDHSSWFLAYAGMLYGFSAVIGYKWPRPVWVWCLLLALGAPAVNVGAHLLFHYNAGVAWYDDAPLRLLAALMAIVPGLGSGVMYRRLARRLRGPRLAQSSTTV